MDMSEGQFLREADQNDLISSIDERFYAQREYLSHDRTTLGDPMVSVVVTVYQHEPYLRDCLDSILAQKTNFPFEIIIGEDDSSDGSRELCIEYAKKYPDIIRLYLRDRNLSVLKFNDRTILLNGAFTRRAVKGQYMAWCEGDDYWIDNDKLQKQIDFLEVNRDCTLCFHACRVIYDDKSRPDSVISLPNVTTAKKITGEEVILRRRDYIMTASICLRAEVIKFLPYWMYLSPTADTAIIFLTIAEGNAGFLPEVMAVYRKFSKNSWSAQKRKNYQFYNSTFQDRLRWINEYDKFTDRRYNKALEKLKRKFHIHLLLYGFKMLPLEQARKEVLQNIKYIIYPDTASLRVWYRFLVGRN